jgi:methyl-accepting chemotaxis protein
MNTKRWIIVLILSIVAIIGIVVSAAGIVGIAVVNEPLTKATVGVINAAQLGLEAMDKLLEPVSGLLQAAQVPLNQIQGALNQLSGTVFDKGIFLTLLPTGLENQLISSLQSVAGLVNGITSTINSINQTLEAIDSIPFVSVPTLADTQLPDKSAQLSQGIDDLSQRISDVRSGAATNLEAVSNQVGEVSSEINGVQTGIDQLRSEAANLNARLETVASKIALWIDIISWVLVLLLVLFIVGFVTLLLLAYSLVKNTRLTLQQGFCLGENAPVSEISDPSPAS